MQREGVERSISVGPSFPSKIHLLPLYSFHPLTRLVSTKLYLELSLRDHRKVSHRRHHHYSHHRHHHQIDLGLIADLHLPRTSSLTSPSYIPRLSALTSTSSLRFTLYQSPAFSPSRSIAQRPQHHVLLWSSPEPASHWRSCHVGVRLRPLACPRYRGSHSMARSGRAALALPIHKARNEISVSATTSVVGGL